MKTFAAICDFIDSEIGNYWFLGFLVAVLIFTVWYERYQDKKERGE